MKIELWPFIVLNMNFKNKLKK